MTKIKNILRGWAAVIVGHILRLFVRFLTAVRPVWHGIEPVPKQRVYYANHVSNGDLPMIWSVLPPAIRRETRAVAAADYWMKNPLRAFIGRDVFRGVLIDRRREVDDDPMAKILEAMAAGDSLIIFPEGGRNRTAEPLMPFKAGLFNMGQAHPEVDLVPTWIANLNSIMPSGEVIPLPLISTVIFGEPVHVRDGEDKDAFLKRAADALSALKPQEPGA